MAPWEYLLPRGDPINEFSDRALTQAFQGALASKSRAKERELSIDVVTIDHENSPDLDDGFWVTETPYGFAVDVAIIDVSVLFEGREALQTEVFQRSFSRYFHSSKREDIYMLPPELAKGAASLLPGALRPVLLTRMIFDRIGALQRNPIRTLASAVNKERLAPKDFARRADEPDAIGTMLKSANRLSRLLEISRRFNYQIPPASADRTPSPNDPRRVVHELMTVTNVVNALLAASHQTPILFRNLSRVINGDAQELGQPEYSIFPRGHAALHLPAYTHMTSPARRAADAISQMNVVASMTNQKIPFSFDHLNERARHLNHAERTHRLRTIKVPSEVLDAKKVKLVAYEAPEHSAPKAPKRNYKTELLDLYQATGAPHPDFELLVHKNSLRVHLRLQLTDRTVTFVGRGANKKAAEQAAAETALRKSRAELHQLAHEALTATTTERLSHSEALEQLCEAIGVEPVFVEQDTTGAYHFAVEFTHDDRFHKFEGSGDSPDAARDDAAARAFPKVARRETIKNNFPPVERDGEMTL